MKQITYNKCKECEFLAYWGYCTESMCGEDCEEQSTIYIDKEKYENKIA